MNDSSNSFEVTNYNISKLKDIISAYQKSPQRISPPYELKLDNKSFTWENVTKSEHETIHTEMNELRVHYIDNMLLYLEGKNKGLKFIKAGTIKITVVSDIDINISYPFEQGEGNIGEIITDIDTQIKSYHHNLFLQNIDVLFDCNFYSEFKRSYLFNCIKNTSDNWKQCLWAFERAKDVLQNRMNNLPKALVDLKTKADTLIKTREGKDALMIKFFQHQKDLADCNNDVFNMFSNIKYLEKDTYRSVGAYLDIVKGFKHLPKNMYRDSILDNYGFAIENLFPKEQHQKQHMNILRFFKYLERICRSILLYIDNDDSKQYTHLGRGILHVFEQSKKMNDKRKHNVYGIYEINLHIDRFINEFPSIITILSKQSQKCDINMPCENTNIKDENKVKLCFEFINNILFVSDLKNIFDEKKTVGGHYKKEHDQILELFVKYTTQFY